MPPRSKAAASKGSKGGAAAKGGASQKDAEAKDAAAANSDAAKEEGAKAPSANSQPPLPELDSEPSDSLGATRMRRLKEHLLSADVERRVGGAVETLLSSAELPVNPFPPLARLLRREELELELLAQQPSGRRSMHQYQHLWRESELQTSALDSQLALLPRLGAAWRPLAQYVDADVVRTLVAGLAGSQLLEGTSRPVGNFTVKTCCALTGAHAFAGRVLVHPRTVELLEHVQVRGPGARLDEALAAFTEHICASALALHASRECLVEEVEVYTGEGDTFDEEATADISDARTTSSARGTPERFGLAALHSRSPALKRALQAAAVAQLPVYLHVLASVPAPAESPGTGVTPPAESAAAPPRWHFVAVQKALCFFYEATSAVLKTAASSRASALAVERPTTPPQRFQPLQQQSLFQAIWLGDADAAWYTKLKENRPEASGGGSASEARARFVSFMRSQVCRFLMRGDHLDLLEAMLLLMPEVPREERQPLLVDMHVCLTSDAAVLAAFSHQSHVLARVLGAAVGAAVPESKRSYVLSVARRQCAHLANGLRRFCARAHWADLEPIKPRLLADLSSLIDEHGQLAAPVPAARRALRRLRRACHALHHGLADTLIQTREHIKTQVGRVWAATPELEVPVSLQPPPMRVQVVDVAAERARQRKTKANPAALAHEAVLMQYVVDTGLDRAVTDALEAVCTARLLKGNPMHALLLHIKGSAQLFELWREPDQALRTSLVNDLTFSDMRHNLYCCRSNTSGSAKQLYYSTQARWSALSTELVDDEQTPAASSYDSALRGDQAIYGVRPSLLLADREQLHQLRQLLGDLMTTRTTTVTQQSRRYECSVHTAFCGDMLLHGRSATLAALYATELREDHFIRGPTQEEAIAIHCQHVLQSLLRCVRARDP